ncbi:hypothetical protein [Corynebacterium doosanense]|uniref:Uncharacterized protein n=1 Tax=Corynebacterium doosanense CAU 212 = DSM 45436 TaxID=558173 RepID=A0A097IJF7_9CORY|nr:hypothetical protein [Corynebacterium doosanense]AIT62250.1 hypothetical protein CDOO_05110 [Corynebacterium doosanense CAU 212 = DSM 45436]
MTSAPAAGPTAPRANSSSIRATWTTHTAAFILAALLALFLHECAHWLTGVNAAITAAAGPVFSLVFGLALLALLPRPAAPGIGHLLWLWTAFASLQEAVTYLIITPFGAGDTAIVVERLDLPRWCAFVACGVGIAGMILVARRFAPHVARLAGPEIGRIRATAFVPWIIGSVVLAALNLLQLSVSELTVTTGGADCGNGQQRLSRGVRAHVD